jgi:hypothetical protein
MARLPIYVTSFTRDETIDLTEGFERPLNKESRRNFNRRDSYCSYASIDGHLHREAAANISCSSKRLRLTELNPNLTYIQRLFRGLLTQRR